MNKEKIINNAKRMYSIVNVLEKTMLVGVVLIVIGAIAVFFVPKGSYMTQSTSLTLGNITVELNDGALPDQQIQIWRIFGGLIAAGMIVAVIYYGFRIVKNILSPMREGRPFDESVSLSIRKLGTLVFWGGLISQIGVFVTDTLLVRNYVNLMDLFKEGVVKEVSVNYEFSLTFLFIAFILYLLSYVFEYGQELQRESDETL